MRKSGIGFYVSAFNSAVSRSAFDCAMHGLAPILVIYADLLSQRICRAAFGLRRYRARWLGDRHRRRRWIGPNATAAARGRARTTRGGFGGPVVARPPARSAGSAQSGAGRAARN